MGAGSAPGILALAVVALTGCYHVRSTSSTVNQDRAERVERKEDGSHVALVAVVQAGGEVAVAAEAQAMCRDLEHGTRTKVARTVQVKVSGMHPFWDIWDQGKSPQAILAMVTMPIGIMLSLSAALAKDQTVTTEPTDDPPVPYTAWKGERTACGEPLGRVQGLPLWLEARRSGPTCSGWRARTGEDGTVAVAQVLGSSPGADGDCRGNPEPGVLLVMADGGAEDREPAPQRQPAAGRTFGSLDVPLTPSQAEALGVMPPVPALDQPRRASGAVTGRDVAGAVTACSAELDPGCKVELDGCLVDAAGRGDPQAARLFCWYEARRCEPVRQPFTRCLEERLR